MADNDPGVPLADYIAHHPGVGVRPRRPLTTPREEHAVSETAETDWLKGAPLTELVEHCLFELRDPYTDDWGDNDPLISSVVDTLLSIHARLAALSPKEGE